MSLMPGWATWRDCLNQKTVNQTVNKRIEAETIAWKHCVLYCPPVAIKTTTSF